VTKAGSRILFRTRGVPTVKRSLAGRQRGGTGGGPLMWPSGREWRTRRCRVGMSYTSSCPSSVPIASWRPHPGGGTPNHHLVREGSSIP